MVLNFKMMHQTVFVFALAVVAFAALDESLVTDDLRELMHSLHKTCAEKTKVNEQHIKNANEGNFAEDGNLKCYIKCIMTEAGAMEEDGTVNFDGVKELLPEKLKEPVKNMMESCGKQATHKDLCDRSLELHKCAYKLDTPHYFLF